MPLGILRDEEDLPKGVKNVKNLTKAELKELQKQIRQGMPKHQDGLIDRVIWSIFRR